MRSLAERINRKDPSRLRATENARAKIAQDDLKAAIARIIKRVSEGNITSPVTIQHIVTEELGKYESLASQKNVAWITDTIGRSAIRADQILRASGLMMSYYLGPIPISTEIKNTLIINVKNQIESLSSATKSKVTAALIEGVNRGDGPRVIAKDISERTAMERNRAVLIARDQTLKANRAASLDSYKKHAIQEVTWLTADDERVCDICGPRDGKVYPIDEIPESHIQCRCIQTPVIPEIGQ